MASGLEEGLLDALTVEAEPFALCELAPQARLSMPPDAAAILHYVIGGSGEIRIGDRPPLPAGPGTLALVPAGARHALVGARGPARSLGTCRPAAFGLLHERVGEDAEGAGLVVLCGRIRLGLGTAGGLVDLLRLPLVDAETPGGIIGRALDLMLGELAAPRVGSRTMVRLLLLQAMVELLRRRVEAADPALVWLPALSDPRLWPALAAMLDRPGAAHSVESLAALAAMSRSRFAERFEAAFGSGPMALLRELRLAHAARLLGESDAGIDRIAALAGFAGRSHFSRLFEARYGVPPGRWRRGAPARAWVAEAPTGG